MTYRINGKVRKPPEESQKIWRHNALLGSCRRAEIFTRGVQTAETTTDECIKLARKIERDLTNLYILLHTRRTQNGQK